MWAHLLLFAALALSRAAPPPGDESHIEVRPRPIDGTLEQYLDLALRESPAIASAQASWEASLEARRGAAAPPEPELKVGVFAQSVETRVGPQQARLSLRQSVPWPTELLGRRDGANAAAATQEARLEALRLWVSLEVREQYWALWRARRMRHLHEQHIILLEELASTTRARVATGATPLAELQQLQLSIERLRDAVRGWGAEETRVEARLRAAIAIEAHALPTVDEPAISAWPPTTLERLRTLAEEHPDVETATALVDGARARVRQARSRRGPGLSIGVDWTITGRATTPGVEGDGKDAVMVGAGVRLPLWQRAYAGAERAALATEEARRAEVEDTRLRLLATVEDAWTSLEDHHNRVLLVRDSLLPLADATYESVLGSYTAARSDIAAVLLAQRDLLELRIQLEASRASFEQSRARVEAYTGQPLPPDPGVTP